MPLGDEVPSGAVVAARIEIIRFLTDEDDVVIYDCRDGSGDDLALVESLGMLRMTEDTLLRDRDEANEYGEDE